jgi:siroheme synthase
MARDWPPSTPAALLLGASTRAASRWIGTLGTLADAPYDEASDDQAPGTLVIGHVVALASVLGGSDEALPGSAAAPSAETGDHADLLPSADESSNH